MKSSISKVLAVMVTGGILLALFVSGFIANKAVQIYARNTPMTARTCVIIDAGHGGVDGGAISCTGMKESEINLEIALRLNDLMHLLGLKTYMIRSEDVSIYTSGESIAAKKISDLKERVRIINNTPNAILVSIHQNYFEDPQYSGTQIFYNSDRELARQLQSAFVLALNPNNRRKAKQAKGVYLMQNIKCPGVLIECGFLSNKIEENLLRDEVYQKKICCVIATVVSCYAYNNSTA